MAEYLGEAGKWQVSEDLLQHIYCWMRVKRGICNGRTPPPTRQEQMKDMSRLAEGLRLVITILGSRALTNSMAILYMALSAILVLDLKYGDDAPATIAWRDDWRCINLASAGAIDHQTPIAKVLEHPFLEELNREVDWCIEVLTDASKSADHQLSPMISAIYRDAVHCLKDVESIATLHRNM